MIAPSIGCSSASVLVPTGDPAFRASQARLARTAEALTKQEGVPLVERTLFLQAESFYRYRFEPPPRKLSTYLAQAAAVAVEFPTFQALASALDLFELRLKAPDGAVQLWESLLTDHPATKLRPWALYRLGWAYRNVGAAGFPHEDGDAAWDDLIAEQPGTALAALALEAKATPWKSKDAATGWSLVPGAGQIYVGETWNGVARVAVALAAAALIVVPGVVLANRRDDLDWGRDWPLVATGLGGIIVLSVHYTLAYQDALRAVVQYNERVEADFDRRHPDAP